MILHLFSQNKLLFVQILCWLLFAALVELGSAILFGLLIDHITDLNHYSYFLLCIGFIIVHFISLFGKEQAMEHAKRKTRILLLDQAMKTYLSASFASFYKKDLSFYLNKLSTEIDVLMDQYMTPLLNAIGLAIKFIFGCFYFFTLSPLILGFLLLGSLGMIGFNNLFKSKLKKSQQNMLESKKHWLANIQTFYHNFSVIKNYDLETIEYNTLHKAICSCADTTYDNHLLLAKLDAINFEIGYILFFGQVFLCGFLLNNGAAAGLAVSAMQASNTITNPVINFSTIRNKLVSNAPILTSFLSYSDISSLPKTKPITTKSPDSIALQFKKLVLEGKTILHDIDYTFKANEKVMIIGPSGCGKTTMLKVLKGEIPLGSSLPDFHESFSFVEQDAPLFPWSIRDNICLHLPFQKERFLQALDLAGISYLDPDHRIRPNHDVLSGGERQRIQIARILYQNRPWVLLDEAFSALDSKTTKAIERTILSQPNLTVVSVCHKPIQENMELYDTIIYMEKGTIQRIHKKEACNDVTPK